VDTQKSSTLQADSASLVSLRGKIFVLPSPEEQMRSRSSPAPRLPVFSSARRDLGPPQKLLRFGLQFGSPQCVECRAAAPWQPAGAVTANGRRAGLARASSSHLATSQRPPGAGKMPARGRDQRARRCRLGGSLSSGRFRACTGPRPKRSGSPTASCSGRRASRSACRGADAPPSRPASWAGCARRPRASRRTA
jgi:hypothetical protein